MLKKEARSERPGEYEVDSGSGGQGEMTDTRIS
jgi:hypothetical protein